MGKEYNEGDTQRQRPVAPFSPHDGYNGGNELSLSLSLSLYLCLYTHALYNYKMFNNFTFALSHIYTHMTFRLFTHMAPRRYLFPNI